MAKEKLLCLLVALLFGISHLTIAQNISNANSELLNNKENNKSGWSTKIGGD